MGMANIDMEIGLHGHGKSRKMMQNLNQATKETGGKKPIFDDFC